MAELKKTLVLGASPNPSRYSFKAVQSLTEAGHPVVAIGMRQGVISGIPIELGKPFVEGIDTVTLYLSPENQKELYSYILQTIRPLRIIFNPGTENKEMIDLAKKQGILVVEDCTLIMLARNMF